VRFVNADLVNAVLVASRAASEVVAR